MNKLVGVITQIQQSGAIMLIDVEVEKYSFSAMLIDSATRPPWISLGNSVNLIFKETEVSLAKNLSGKISMRNKLLCKISTIERGALLSVINLTCGTNAIASAITTRSVDSLELQTGDEVTALIKANEISISN
jgi:molybdopterin-binding protein